MQIKIESLTFEITPAIRNLIEKKIGSLKRLLTRFEGKSDLVVNVRILKTTFHHRHGEIFKTSLSLNIGKHTIVAEEEDADWRVSLEKAKDKMKRNIESYKEKEIQKLRKSK